MPQHLHAVWGRVPALLQWGLVSYDDAGKGQYHPLAQSIGARYAHNSLVASAATRTSCDDDREAAAQHERLAKLASSQRSLLVQLRHVLGRYTDDLRSPAPGLAAA